MTKQELTQKMNDAGAVIPGKTVKIDFGGDEGTLMLDGTANSVTDADGPADTTIKVSWAGASAEPRLRDIGLVGGLQQIAILDRRNEVTQLLDLHRILRSAAPKGLPVTQG